MKEAIIRLGADEKKIEVINFGIDTEKFKPSSKNDTLIKKLGLTDEKIIEFELPFGALVTYEFNGEYKKV